MANEYESIKTKAQLDELKLSYTMREVRDKWNANMDELDDRADAADAKFEAIEEKLDTIETDATKVEPSQTNGNIIINGTETPVYRLPQLTPSDVGADPAGTAASVVATHNSDQSAHTYIQGLVSTAQQKADDAYALAEGRENATSYTNYQAMVAALNAESSAILKVGDNIYVETVGVPDLWVSDVLDSKVSYTYTSDQAIVDALNNPSIGYINIGWYRLSELETAKVDLSGYAKKTTTVTGIGALGGGGALSQNRTITHNAGSAPNVASGLYKISTDAYSHVSGATAVATADLTPLLDGSYLAKNNPTGTGSLSLNRKANTTVGTNSVAVGALGEASGNYSFAGGQQCVASGLNSHAEGRQCVASGESSFAIGIEAEANKQCSFAAGSSATASGVDSFANGINVTASGAGSHAEGSGTQAVGAFSYAGGYKTTAQKAHQHTFGKYNVVDNENNPLNIDDGFGRYVEIVGNGTAENARSNARTLDWNGNEVLAGTSTATSFIKSGGTSSQFLKADGSVDSSSYATEAYVNNAVGAIDTKKAFTFTATDARWSSQADVDGMFVCTFNSSNTTGFKTSYIPLSCFNLNNEQVVATLAFDHTSGSECVKIKSDTKFAGTIYVI